MARIDPSREALERRRERVREELMLADHALRRAPDLWPRSDLAWQDIDEARLQLRVAADRIRAEGAPRG